MSAYEGGVNLQVSELCVYATYLVHESGNILEFMPSVTAVCIMIDRSEKLVECGFPSPLTGFDGFE